MAFVRSAKGLTFFLVANLKKVWIFLSFEPIGADQDHLLHGE